MVPDATLLFVGLDALCLLLYLARRRRRRRARRPRFDYLGMYADS
jgi:hypothetical protein